MWLICFFIGHNYKIIEPGTIQSSGCCWLQYSLLKCNRCNIYGKSFRSGCDKYEGSEMNFTTNMSKNYKPDDSYWFGGEGDA